MLVALILLHFSTSGSNVANTYASLYWGHVLPTMFSLVLIRWLGPLGRRVGASNHASGLFCLGVAVSLGFVL